MKSEQIHPSTNLTNNLPEGSISCGEASIRLLSQYGVDTVFGIPGVHTLDFYRGFKEGTVRHVQARHEQGTSFMADGYARYSNRPGVTNALTAIVQSWADSMPVLLLSSESDSRTHGKDWETLHEIPDQQAVTAPLTTLSLRAHSPEEVPEMIAQAFTVFKSGRPRPVHLWTPINVLSLPVHEE